MTLRQPDSPKTISLSRLEELDAAEPGTYYASAKLDGRRRVAYFDGTTWTYRAKNRGDAQPIAEEARKEFESLPWPAGIGLDVEITGLRAVGDADYIYIFDLLYFQGEWTQMSFEQRRVMLAIWGLVHRQRVRYAKYVANPGMMDLFKEQIADPLSEGIVIRRADQVNIGHHEKSQENPFLWKCKYARLTERGGK